MTRSQIIDNAKRIRANCIGLIADARHWSEHHPDEERIDPDADGALTRIITAIDKMLANETIVAARAGESANDV